MKRFFNKNPDGEKTTLKKELEMKGFDFKNGKMIIVDEEHKKVVLMGDEIKNHSSVNREFNNGYGQYEMPVFIAEDKDALYIGNDYDGKGSVIKILKDINKYLNEDVEIPVSGSLMWEIIEEG